MSKRKKTWKKVYQFNRHTLEPVAVYDSIGETCRRIGLGRSAVCRRLYHGYVGSFDEFLLSFMPVPPVLQTEGAERGEDPPERMAQKEVIRLLSERQGQWTYRDFMQKTGWTFEELRDLYDRKKIYRRR